MNKFLIPTLIAGVLIIIVGIWYWSVKQGNDDMEQLPATHVYEDATLGFSITLPTALSSTTNDSLYSVDSLYKYVAMGEDKAISGVKFTIPQVIVSGTNLSADSYVSVEHLSEGQVCDVVTFKETPSVKSQTIYEGTFTYLFASSTEAAVGNRYEEHIYVLSNSNPCIAVRYFIHYAVMENFPDGAVNEFNKSSLLNEFDEIRRTLQLSR